MTALALETKARLVDWFGRRAFTEVHLEHNVRPTPDPHASYSVSYEATFVPDRLEMARLEIWVTEDGSAAVGFETRERVAKRLGIRRGRSGFCAGHEPLATPPDALMSLLDLVAAGRIGIAATLFPIVGLLGTQAVAGAGDRAHLVETKYPDASWLRDVERTAGLLAPTMLKFEPWA